MSLTRLFAILALSTLAVCVTASVPAVVVDSRADRASAVSALTSARVDAKQLADALRRSVDAAPAGALLVFTVDEGLALADFARSGGDIYAGAGASPGGAAFANVAGLSQKLGGRHLLVADAADLLPTLRGFHWPGPPVDTAAGSAGDADRIVEAAAAAAGANAPRLVVVRAADAAAADRLLGAVSAALQSRGLPFVAVFTAARESAAAADAAASGRHLLAVPTAAPSSNGTFVNCSGDVLMYFTSLQVSIKLADKVQTQPAIPAVEDGSTIIDTALSQCTAAGGNRTLALSYPQSALPSTLASLKLTLNFIGDKSSTSTWTVASGTVSLTCRSGAASNCTSVPETAFTAQSLAGFQTPNGSCYHCTDGAVLATVAGTAANASVTLAFKKLQIQPFSVPASGKFSKQVNDCVGFFSVEVWFSLLVLLVVTVILMYGVLMLASVATPDRFDDPKGKTIQVNVQEGGN